MDYVYHCTFPVRWTQYQRYQLIRPPVYFSSDLESILQFQKQHPKRRILLAFPMPEIKREVSFKNMWLNYYVTPQKIAFDDIVLLTTQVNKRQSRRAARILKGKSE